MTLYEIDAEIERLYQAAVDPETGEVDTTAFEWLDRLAGERNAKVENVALWYKNTAAESKAIEDEIKALSSRKSVLDNKLEWQKKYLIHALDGQRFETPKVAVSFKRSQTVDIPDIKAFCMAYADRRDIVTSRVEQKPDKLAIKKLMLAGEKFNGATLKDNINPQIK